MTNLVKAASREEARLEDDSRLFVVFRVDEAELLARRLRLVRSGERPVLGELRLREHLASFEWPTPEECPLEVATLCAQLGFGEAEPG